MPMTIQWQIDMPNLSTLMVEKRTGTVISTEFVVIEFKNNHISYNTRHQRDQKI